MPTDYLRILCNGSIHSHFPYGIIAWINSNTFDYNPVNVAGSAFITLILFSMFISFSVLDHRSLPPVFESRRGHIWRLFRLSLRLITFGSRSAHLAYLVHKSGRKTSIIISIIIHYDHGHVDHNGYLYLAVSIYSPGGSVIVVT